MDVDVTEISHRPWTMPSGPWIMAMRWEHLAFLHWPYPAEEIQRRLPADLRVDLYREQAYIAVVPFLMSGVRPRGLFPVPGVSTFPELNVRTYVTDGEKPGVWFFSLDAHSKLAVRAARAGFHLPYFDATMRCDAGADAVQYESLRIHRGERPARFAVRYGSKGSVYRSQPGELDHWLTERYCLHSSDARGRVYRGEVHHGPWPLTSGRVEIQTNELLEGDGLPPVEGEPLVHVARQLDVVAWWPRRLP